MGAEREDEAIRNDGLERVQTKESLLGDTDRQARREKREKGKKEKEGEQKKEEEGRSGRGKERRQVARASGAAARGITVRDVTVRYGRPDGGRGRVIYAPNTQNVVVLRK